MAKIRKRTMSEKIRFVSSEPFAKYESARFVCGVYDASPKEAEKLRKSVYYGHRFRELELQEEATEENTQEEKKVLDNDQKNVVNYKELSWFELQKFASSRGINTYHKKKIDLLRELKEKLGE